MLSIEEKQEIEAELARYDQKEAACIDALKILQRKRGWISDEALQEVAQFLEMPPSKLDGIATFYNLIFRRPVGRHIILVCNSVSCWLEGYDQLLEHLTSRLGAHLGETTSDGRFTLLPIACLGTCDHAPAMLVDNDLHQELTAEKIDQVMAYYQ